MRYLLSSPLPMSHVHPDLQHRLRDSIHVVIGLELPHTEYGICRTPTTPCLLQGHYRLSVVAWRWRLFVRRNARGDLISHHATAMVCPRVVLNGAGCWDESRVEGLRGRHWNRVIIGVDEIDHGLHLMASRRHFVIYRHFRRLGGS